MRLEVSPDNAETGLIPWEQVFPETLRSEYLLAPLESFLVAVVDINKSFEFLSTILVSVLLNRVHAIYTRGGCF